MAVLGCIADDFTGAGDIASFLAKGGMKTILYSGIPADGSEEAMVDVDAIVIALKTRTQKTADAVAESLDAVRWLKHVGCMHYYVKYCSTFDSTKEGNIGPICDAVMSYLNTDFTLLCPALPMNGRTVRNGNLYVNSILLHKSSMKDHPLTPMWDSDIAALMECQSKYPCYKIGRDWKQQNEGRHTPYYLIPDCEDKEDQKQIVKYFGDLKLLTGGSGLAEDLASYLMHRYERFADMNVVVSGTDGHALILAGSCSVTTREQIEDFRNRGGCCIQITPEEVLEDGWHLLEVWERIRNSLRDEDVLVYTSDSPERVRQAQSGCKDVSEKLEQVMAGIAELAVKADLKKLIIAGGETSGAVTKRLGMNRFWIGESVAPGVPVMVPEQKRQIRLVLKSGNFGQIDFFARAIQLMKAGNK